MSADKRKMQPKQNAVTTEAKPKKPLTLQQSLLRICAVFGVLIVITYVGGMMLYEQRLSECMTTAENNFPLYPGALYQERQQYVLSSPFGTVEMWVHLQSQDTPQNVWTWYNREIGYLSPQALQDDPELAVAHRHAWVWEVVNLETDQRVTADSLTTLENTTGTSSIYLVTRCP